MLFNNSFADPQPQAASIQPFCRLKGFEQVSFHVCAYPVAGIGHSDPNPFPAAFGMLRRPFAYQDAASSACCVKGISDQVGKDLAKLPGIAGKRRRISITMLHHGVRTGKAAVIEHEN